MARESALPGTYVVFMVDLIFQILFEGLCYYTGKLVLPLVSFGWLKVEDRPGPWWNPFARLPNGSLAVSSNATAAFGFIFWIVVAIAAVIIWKRA